MELMGPVLQGIWIAIKTLWPFLLIALIILIAKGLWERILADRRFDNLSASYSGRDLLGKLRHLSPTEFEEYVAFIFRQLGYQTEVVGGSHDGGIDIVLQKDGRIAFVQCKKFIHRTVSVGEIRDFYGALIDRLANSKAYFVTTNKFTFEAESFAQDKPIELIDGYRLLDLIREAKADSLIPSPAKQELCPACGGRLLVRNGARGQFYGCSNFPKCRFTKNI